MGDYDYSSEEDAFTVNVTKKPEFWEQGDDQHDPANAKENVHKHCVDILPPEAQPRFHNNILPNLHIFRPITSAEPICDIIKEYIRNGLVHKYVIRCLAILQIIRKDERPRTCDIRRVLLWHGTRSENVSGILEQGFQLPELKARNMFGAGVYFSDRFTKSAQYCFVKESFTVGAVGWLFLCEVALGNSCLVKRPHRDFEKPPLVKDDEGRVVKCDSVRSEGQFIPDKRERKIVDGVLVPCGKTVENFGRKVFAVKYNEYIVYAVENVRPRYLIKFEIVSKE